MKRLKPTDKIKEKLAAVLGSDDFDIANFAIFETVAINDLPVSKIGSIYDGSRMTEGTLSAMVEYINTELLPLHTLHQQSRELPVGRVFHAELNKTTRKDGKYVNEVRALFYIPTTTDLGKQLADGLDTGLINEVSVGSRPKSLKCSAPDCGFDYMRSNVSFMHWLDQTCSNDHTVGKDGIHLIFDGLKKFYELSLISQGAADHARIVAPEEAIAAANDDVPAYQVLYATKGKEKENIMKLTAAQIAELRASLEKDGKRAITANFAGVTACMGMIKDDMTLSDAEALRGLFKTALAEFNTANPETPPAKPAGGEEKLNLSISEVLDLKVDLRAATTELTALKASTAEKDTQIATLTTENGTLKISKAQLDALLSEIAPVKDFLKVTCQAMLVASGVTNPTVPDSFADLIATIKTSQGKLSKLPTGGLLLSSESGAPGVQNQNGSKDSSAFKTKK